MSDPSAKCCVVLVLFLLWYHGVLAYQGNIIGETRTIEIRQGYIRGLLVAPSQHPDLKHVEVYLGIPYAAPPVSNQRFMPPGDPPPWPRTKLANTMPPVCPQVLPKLEEHPRTVSSGRMAYLKRLLPYLKNQSEDCLHLNIYAPAQDSTLGPSKYPVLVFIHGESFSWNSGNPYDGTVLASYADVVFVTINFRLGILGFLRPSLDSSFMAVSNLGLLDQIAALVWIKKNIHKFGGDPTSVTLIGHHTGAVAVNYLMLSPVAQEDLFHRVILMSGSALADWGQGPDPQQTALRVAEALNCPHHASGFLECLRKKRVSDLLEVQLEQQLGPTIDGIVIPNDPKDVMANYTNLFKRADLLCGVTEEESYHMLDGISLAYGLAQADRDKILNEYFREKFQIHPEMAQAQAVSLYTDIITQGRINAGNTGLQNRDATIALLSDARVVAPTIQTAIYHAEAAQNSGKRSFFYVFGYRSSSDEYPSAQKSVHGEELPYVLGIPLDGPKFHYDNHYSLPENLLSEVLMTLWTNFAKTGDPNTPKRHNYLSQSFREWLQYDTLWPDFDVDRQAYYHIDIPPKIGFKYREPLVQFWNKHLPEYLQKPSLTPIRPKPYPRPLVPEWTPEDPRQYPRSYPGGLIMYGGGGNRPTSKPMYGTVRKFENDPTFTGKDDQHMDGPPPTDESTEQAVAAPSSFTMNLVIIVGVCFLIINIISLVFVCYQKRKLRQERGIIARFRAGSSPSVPSFEDPFSKQPQGVKSILKSSEGTYEPVKPRSERLSKWLTGGMMNRQESSSTVTMDPHTKVTEWIAQEMEQTPHYVRKDRISEKNEDYDRVSMGNVKFTPSSKKKVKKVSVAIDATPSARSASVLKQTPIELTKSMDCMARKIKHRPALQRSEALDEEEQKAKEARHSDASTAVADTLDAAEIPIPVIVETAVIGSPIERPKEERLLKTFDPNQDINVTCRDEAFDGRPLTPEEALDNIKRRNFPKVLPDLADSDTERKMKLDKRMSLPQYASVPPIEARKVPPPPPPRVSTLGRKSHRNTIPNFMNTYANLKDIAAIHDKPEKRPEPTVIIKPKTPDTKKKGPQNPNIPRVTHHPEEEEPPPPPPNVMEEPRAHKTKPGAKSPRDNTLKVKPVKKTQSTDTTESESSTATASTVKSNPNDKSTELK